jgi:hypothetical protein
MRKILVVALLAAATPALAAHQDWRVSHQPDRFTDRVMMEAWSDADQGAGRMALYCDTESGFRLMFLPVGRLMPEGPARITLTIDSAAPQALTGDAFGDDKTDVVTIHNSTRVQRALSTARKVAVHFVGADGRGSDAAFSFGNLAAERETLMKVCPVR